VLGIVGAQLDQGQAPVMPAPRAGWAGQDPRIVGRELREAVRDGGRRADTRGASDARTAPA
jgi:hypothetical protein